ncbi:MAG: diguanylate cyclase [Lachnospiraceae bacterium]|nr:diguanylate cyclase [Lachnospiraceae bacterium]
MKNMNKEPYPEHVRTLIDDVYQLSRTPGRKQAGNLAALYREAKRIGDNALLGYVCFHYADMYYFMRPDYRKFRRYAKLAVKYLLASDNRETLGFTYNLVAIDAQNGGSYSIAYNYYLNALTISEEIGNLTLRAGAGANIGRLLMELGQYETAANYLRDSLQQMKMRKDSSLYVRNMITLHYLNGVNALRLGDTPLAEQSLSQIMRYMHASSDPTIREFWLPHIFLRAMIALAHGDDITLETFLNELTRRLSDEVQLYDYIEDIEALCLPLLNAGYHAHVKRVLDICGEKILGCGITHTERRYYELKLKYDQAADMRKNVFRDMQELHIRSVRQHAEQNERHLYAIGLSSMMADLREKQSEVNLENKELQMQADTDPLTELPNRYAMNDVLEAAFERAYQEQTSLSVGILDVDYFKEFNDTYGHQAGDVCLNAIAGILRTLCRQHGFFCAR